MRIIIDGRLVLPAYTGIGRYLLGLAPALAQLPGDDEIELWIQGELPRDHMVWRLDGENCPGHNRLHLRSLTYPHMSLSGQFRLPLDLLRSHPDLLHVPHIDLPWLAPGKAVITLHDLKYLVLPDDRSRRERLRRLGIRLLAAFSVRRASRVICDSNHTARDAVRLLGARKEKLRVIPLGAGERFSNPMQDEAIAALRKRYGLDGNYILFVGERRPHKNLPGLIRAFDRLCKMTSQPLLLAIAGSSYRDYREPERLVEKMGLNSQVRFLDAVPEGDLPGLYQSASACALLSCYEGFGLPVLEAMAAGTPVLASNRTSLPEVAGGAAQLVAPDDPQAAAEALYRLLSDADLRQASIQNGRDRARQFTWERCARRTMGVYQETTNHS